MKRDKSKKIKYIFNHVNNDFSGSTRVLSDMLSSEIFSEKNTIVITSNRNGFLNHEKGKISFIYPNTRSRFFKLIFYALSQLQIFFILIYIFLNCSLNNERPIVISNTFMSLASLIASKIFRKKSIFYAHETSIGKTKVNLFQKHLVSNLSDHIIYASNYLKRELDLNNKNYSVIPNGLRKDFNGSAKVDSNFKYNYGHILFVGTLEPYKGIYEFIKIANNLSEFKFIACLNCSENSLKEFLRNNDLPDNLLLKNNPTDLEKLYRDSFLLLSLTKPPVYESFGLSILEGISSGSPCIVPEKGGHLDFVDSDCCLIIDSLETLEIIRFIKRLKDDQYLWNEYSSNCLERSSIFSHNAYIKNINIFFNNTGNL